jgi:hypothetical protein
MQARERQRVVSRLETAFSAGVRCSGRTPDTAGRTHPGKSDKLKYLEK